MLLLEKNAESLAAPHNITEEAERELVRDG